MGTKKATTGGQTRFAQIPSVSTPRSTFDRSCGVKTTFSGGQLVPIFTDEVIPGDTMVLTMSHFARLATPLHPIMDNLYLDGFFFFVPFRLLWENWEKFNGAQDDPGDSTDYTIPQLVHNNVMAGSLADYFGWPIHGGEITASAMYHRAYSLIWNEWFRDQNLQASAIVKTDDGPDDFSDYPTRIRGKRHDYFTSCLPWPQKGDAVTIGLGSQAPLAGTIDIETSGVSPNYDWDIFTNAPLNSLSIPTDNVQGMASGSSVARTGTPMVYGDETGVQADLTGAYADLSAATAVTINNLRQAFQIQKLLERDARGGTRYTEVLRSHFGVISPDQRLQRPEYLGGFTSMLNMSTVPQQSASEAGTPQGNLAAYGISAGSHHGFTKSFTEHGCIIGMINARADLSYQQGLHRNFSRETKLDFYWPALAHLGEQAVLNKEIYYQNDPADELVFGYQERFAEYRYKPSIITSKMRSQDPQSLDVWHLAQDFETLPTLGVAFMWDMPPIDRVIAIPSEPHFILDCFFKYKSVRPMPTYSVPGLIDHF